MSSVTGCEETRSIAWWLIREELIVQFISSAICEACLVLFPLSRLVCTWGLRGEEAPPLMIM